MGRQDRSERTGRRGLRAAVVCVRWAARGLSLLVLAMVVLFAVGEGFDPAALDQSEHLGMVAFATTLAGLLVAWKWELLGGLLVIGSMVAFGMVGVAADGRWGWSGPVFWAILALGVGFAACGLLSHTPRRPPDA